MKAIVYNQYGTPDALTLTDVPQPSPKDDEALVKVHAVAVNAVDYRLLSGPVPRIMGFGVFRPNNKILGADIAGRVVAVGKKVAQFKPGDDVFGDLSGIGFGGFAEYVCAPETLLVTKPGNLTFEQAAAVPMPAVTALQGLRDKGRIQAGQKALIHGASGGVGTFAVQVGKALGAEVTAVVSTKKLDLLRSLGADHVIDYTKEGFAQNGRRYDLILAVNGYRPLSEYRRALNPKGTYVMVGGAGGQIFQAMLFGPLVSKPGGHKVVNLLARPNQNDLTFIKELIEAGKVTPVIDRTYPLQNTAEAVRYLGEGHAAGKVVITVA